MKNDPQWITRWGYVMALEPIRPNVWRRQGGGFVVRGRATDPRTGKQRTVTKALIEMSAAAAEAWLHNELEAIRSGSPRTIAAKTRFNDYAVSLLKRKIDGGDIKSAKGIQKWSYVLERHLLPAFGDYYIDQLRHGDFQDWRAAMGRKITAGEYSPNSADDWIAILRVIMEAAKTEFSWAVNPLDGVKDFDASEHATYTDEEPNALTTNEAMEFLRAMRERWPQHFAMTSLGFATGLRPSSLRPLRRSGDASDVLWDEGVLLVRRSHTVGDAVMNTTKTKRHQRIALPAEVIAILRWHVEFQIPDGVPSDCELLFPSETGSFRAPSCLDKPFADVAKAIGLSKRLTPRGMRRTFQDLCRAAEVRDVVARAVSGHTTRTDAAPLLHGLAG